MRPIAVVLLSSSVLLAACSPADGPAADPPTTTLTVGFPEATACASFDELLAAADRGDAAAVDDAARELDVLALLEPVDETGAPSRVGALTRRVRDLDDVGQVRAWAGEVEEACARVVSVAGDEQLPAG